MWIVAVHFGTYHPEGTSNNLDIWEGFTSFWLRYYNGGLMDTLPFTDFQQCKWLRPISYWKIWISEPPLGILKKIQHKSALPNIEYNCAVLFLVKCTGRTVLGPSIVKFQSEILANIRSVWCFCRVYLSVLNNSQEN